MFEKLGKIVAGVLFAVSSFSLPISAMYLISDEAEDRSRRRVAAAVNIVGFFVFVLLLVWLRKTGA